MLQELKSFKLKHKQAMTNYRYNSQQHQLMYQINGSNTSVPSSLSDQGTLETNFRRVRKLGSSCKVGERNNWYSGHRA